MDAFRAGGILTEDKKCCLENVAKLLNISTERHKAEVRRAVNDELLTTISSRLSGPDPDYTWTREGRRIIPVLPRANISTSLTPVAQRAAESVARHNATLLRPSQTRTAPPPPSLPKPDHLLGSSPPLPAAAVPDNDHLHNGVPEIHVKPELKPRTAVVDTSSDNNSDNGVVVLPSGTAVRVSSNQTKPGRGGKRKRSASVSKSIEVFPGGLAQLEAAAVKIEAGDGSDKSPSRKVTSVLGAGHGYARPLPSNSPLPDRQVVLPLMDPSVTKRGPGRPPGPASPQLMAGRGRPRLLSGGTRGRGGAKPRGGVLITPRMATPLTQPQLLQATPTSLALRPTSGVASSPRATTIQLKQETSTSGLTNPALQGLKVISHSSTKIVPKSATAVYVVPSMGRSSSVSAMPGSGQRIVTVNTLPRVLSSSGHVMTPTLPGVIKTVRPGAGAGKPSVIVLQKGAGLPSVSGGVALYRPARARVVSGTPAPPGHAPSANNLYVVDMSAQTLNRTTQGIHPRKMQIYRKVFSRESDSRITHVRY